MTPPTLPLTEEEEIQKLKLEVARLKKEKFELETKKHELRMMMMELSIPSALQGYAALGAGLFWGTIAHGVLPYWFTDPMPLAVVAGIAAACIVAQQTSAWQDRRRRCEPEPKRN